MLKYLWRNVDTANCCGNYKDTFVGKFEDFCKISGRNMLHVVRKTNYTVGITSQ